MKNKKLLFSLIAKDFKWGYFSTGGPGGQNQNRKLNGVRCTHEASGAVGESREFKSQDQNKKQRFKDVMNTKSSSCGLE